MTLVSKSYYIFSKAMLSARLRNAEVWEEMSLFYIDQSNYIYIYGDLKRMTLMFSCV